MKQKIIFLIMLLLLLNINNIYAHNQLQINVNETITIKDQPVSLDITLKNNDYSSRWYNITTHMAPFGTQIENTYIYLEPNKSQTTRITITPLEKSLTSVYQATIEISSENYSKKIPIKIIQQSNLECLIDLEYYLNYDRIEKEYALDIKLTNNKKLNQDIFLDKIVDVNNNLILNISQEHLITPTEDLWLGYRFIVDENKANNLYLTYGCKNFTLKTQEIKIESLEKPKKTNNFGMIVLTSAKDIYNSLVFQIILIVVLIFLVLSFSTRYIKYMYRK
jgi:hypothetical protein